MFGFGTESYNVFAGSRFTKVSGSRGTFDDLEAQQVGIVGFTLHGVTLSMFNDTSLYQFLADGGDQADSAGGGIDARAFGWDIAAKLRIATGIPIRNSTYQQGGDEVYNEIYDFVRRGDILLSIQKQLADGNYMKLHFNVDSGEVQHEIQSKWMHKSILDIPTFLRSEHFVVSGGVEFSF